MGFLVLESGEIFKGISAGKHESAGEVVFNTSHSGYEEIATDPSYFNQIVVMTAPMQGNYGVQKEVWESRRIWIEGFICLQIQDTPRDAAWKNLLLEHGVPVLTELDTRALVLKLRQGTVWGAIVNSSDERIARERARELIKNKKQGDLDWVYRSSRVQPEVRAGEFPMGPRVAVLDFGVKENILRELQKRCSEIKIFNSRSDIADILSYKPQGLMLTNGPGDPQDVQKAVGTVKELIGQLPIFGICMGHQVLGLALGAKTYKLKFGHRGANHPIEDTLLNQIYMSSQNHGYAVDAQTLPADAKITQTNLNDHTVAGFYSEQRKFLGIQYHPESSPGPHEATALFSFFVERMI